MKTISFKHTLIAMLMALPVGSVVAQNTMSGYFVDGYEYRFRMNPAIGNDSTTFISIPGVANVNVAARGNLNLTDLIYSRGGQTVTFMNPSVSATEVLRNFGKKSKLGADVNITILSGGFKAWGGYNTVSINARAGAQLRLPRELVRFLKEGAENSFYDISDIGVRAQSFAELALGHSHDINSKWRVGGTVKFLFGAADIDAKFTDATLELGTNDWIVTSDAEIRSSMKGLRYKQKFNDRTKRYYVDGLDVKDPGLGGFGVAFDLGAVFTANQDWQFSASVLDLGFIRWSNDLLATTNGKRTFNTDRFSFNVDDDADNSFKNEWKHVRDDFTELYQLDDAGDQGGRTTMLSATLNFAAQYTAPFYRKLNFGLINTTKLQGKYTWTEFRLSANVAPIKQLSASANVVAGNYGAGFGWLINYHNTGFGIFAGMDHTLGRVTKDYVPLSSNASFNLGMNILF